MSPFDKIADEKNTKSNQTVKPLSRSSGDLHSDVNDEEDTKKKYFSEHCLILDLSAVNYIDTNGMKMLLQLINDYKKVSVNVYLCNPQGN